MPATRPTVSVFNSADQREVLTQVPLPGVFSAPIRPDVVNFVHTNMNKNKRQAYAVAMNAAMQTAAESWGTGRAVSRIPRVPGGGTHRSGQGAFGNMCRGGRMFNPSRVWRKWHRKVNKNQRRYAVCSALAASGVPALVMARGHRIDRVPEVPLVLGGGIESTQKTKDAVALLSRFGLAADAEKSKQSKKVRTGKGKARNRRYVMRRGPLIVFDNKDGIDRAFRNLPGVDLCHVDRLNLLKLAPGGHVGRSIVWTQGAFEKLDSIYGTSTTKSTAKVNYTLPRTIVENGDIARIINSDEVQKVLRAQKRVKTKTLRKKNPLKNYGVMVKLNPYAAQHRRAEIRAAQAKKSQKAKRKAEVTTSREQRLNFVKLMKE